MSRLRIIAAILGCLAVLASGLMTVAAAAVPSVSPAAERSTASAPCTHCDDCDGAPCPAPTAACVQACVGVPPSLTVATFRLPMAESGKVRWSPGAIVLSGLSPPPDPFPPRA
jgi:hypothetical protein